MDDCDDDVTTRTVWTCNDITLSRAHNKSLLFFSDALVEETVTLYVSLNSMIMIEHIHFHEQTYTLA